VLAAVIFSRLQRRKERQEIITTPGCRHEVKERVLKSIICNLCCQRRERNMERKKKTERQTQVSIAHYINWLRRAWRHAQQCFSPLYSAHIFKAAIYQRNM
jgi:hypothetical protein